MSGLFDNRYLYTYADGLTKSMNLSSSFFKSMADLLADAPLPYPFTDNDSLERLKRTFGAKLRLFESLTQTYDKPSWNIDETLINDKRIDINIESILDLPFCELIHFKKSSYSTKQAKLLIVAPMAGHYATLLRDTINDALPYYDIYVTDWKNAREISISRGAFDFDSYINYVIRFFETLGPDLHVLAICQAGVPTYSAVCILEGDPQKAATAPKSLMIMGSPIDTRESPTTVNDFAADNTEDWFEDNVLCNVPSGYPGERRLVYPGFVQLSAFWNMNASRHQKSIKDAMLHYIEGDFEQGAKIRSFYAEYFSVMDLTAEFYLQTIMIVFKDHLLPKGELVSRGRKVLPGNIKNTALMAIEGDRDDICGVGQTRAAIELANQLSSSKKHYLNVENCGHYGLFNGRRYRDIILPEMLKFTKKAAK